MALGEAIGSIAGGVLGAVGGVLDANSKNNAIKRQQDLANTQRVRAGEFYDKTTANTGNAVVGSRNRIDTREGIAGQQLQQFLQGEAGLAQRSIADTMKQGRRQAAASGLIGGGQEAGMVNPAIERILSNFAQVGTKAQLDFQSLFGGMNQNLDSQEIGGLQQQQGLALQGFQNAQQNELNSLMNYGQSPIAGGIAGNLAGSQAGQQVGKGFDLF